MSGITNRIVALSILLCTFGLSEAVGQEVFVKRYTEVAVGEAVREFRSGGSKYVMESFLRQEYAPRPLSDLDALADSLVAIALEADPDGPEEVRKLASNAIRHLIVSSAAWEGNETPYPGGLERLIRIFEGSKDRGLKLYALSGISEMPDTAGAIDYLGKVVTAGEDEISGYMVFNAFPLLTGKFGDRGLEHAHQLYREGRITHRGAQGHLNYLKKKHGWN